MKTYAYAPAPAGAATGPATPAGSIDAFRRVFEREQIATLARFRSVPGGASAQAAEAGNPGGEPRTPGRDDAPQDAVPARAAPSTPEASATPCAPRPALPVAYAVRAPVRMASAALSAAPSTAAPDAEAAAAEHAPGAVDAALRAACADAGSPWPLRKLHCRVDDDGVHVWLRDAQQQPGEATLDAGIAALRQALKHAGYRLAGFTLNGVSLI